MYKNDKTKTKSHPSIVNNFKELPFYNEYIKKQKLSA